MSANVKKAGRIGTKVVAVFLFLVLVMFNVEVGLYDGETPESGILGLTMSVFVPETIANSDPGDCGVNCGGLSCLHLADCGGAASCGGAGSVSGCTITCASGEMIICNE